ncbi:hypothetical protein HAX54_023673 [Datura stramonium]|uniref:Uncharacterized protein n=1 Tax=Datura stramonium TaxID=4076 RepID=A0ABS8UYQ4_DATST|nr:hypothetical protein [Datura stramonium]
MSYQKPGSAVARPQVISVVVWQQVSLRREISGMSKTRGWMLGNDVITFVLDKNPIKDYFGCGKDQIIGHFSSSCAGCGIGRRVMGGGYSLPTRFEADIMSMCLPGFYSKKHQLISFHTTPARELKFSRCEVVLATKNRREFVTRTTTGRGALCWDVLFRFYMAWNQSLALLGGARLEV